MKEYDFADIQEGMTEELEVTVHESMIDSFMAISGDRNPLHADHEYAVSRGFQDRVVHGMLTASFFSQLVGMYLPGKNALLNSINISFHHPVFSGDRLQVRGEVTSVHRSVRQIEIRAVVTNQEGKRVSKARIGVGVHGQ